MKMPQNFKEILAENAVIGMVIPDAKYGEMLINAAGNLGKEYNKILYISINKPYKKLVGKFKQNHINPDKFYFIDCITRTAGEVNSTENCIYVSSPKALDEIKTAIFDVFRKQEIDVALIDSPSVLSTYYEHTDVLKLMHLLMTKLDVAECKGIFPFQKESAGPLRRSIEMFTDEIVYLESDNDKWEFKYEF